jgi:DnaJ-domain-containing protein 1
MFLWLACAAFLAAFVVATWLYRRMRKQQPDKAGHPQPLRSRPQSHPQTAPKNGRTVTAERVKSIAVQPRPSGKRAAPLPPAPAVQHVHASYLPLQKNAIHAVFSKLNVPYIPAYLVNLLHQYDARYALHRFCEVSSVPYSSLMDPGDALHSAARDELAGFVGFLIDVEETAKECGLSPDPVYDALAESKRRAEECLDRLRAATRLAKRITNTRLSFPPIQALAQGALAKVKAWDTLRPDETAEIASLADKLETYDQDFARAEESINEAILKLRAVRLTDANDAEYRQLLNERARLRHQLTITTDFGSALELFRQLAERFGELVRRAASEAHTGRRRHRRDGPSIEDACRVLNLSVRATVQEIKSAYRRLALQHHPDRNPTDPTAKEKFQNLNAAYQVAMMSAQAQART